MRARHTREYSAAELALFAEYVSVRHAFEPSECRGGKKCWVQEGPPACQVRSGTVDACCVGCGGSIRVGR